MPAPQSWASPKPCKEAPRPRLCPLRKEQVSAAWGEWAGRHWLESGVGSALALRLETAAVGGDGWSTGWLVVAGAV